MRVQSISLETAEELWNARMAGNKRDTLTVNIDELGSDAELLSDFELDELKDQLVDVKNKYDGKNLKRIGGEIDANLPEIIHHELKDLTGVHELSSIGFWRWLSNDACDGFFWDFIMWRFNSDKVINWGITGPGNVIEVYLYRAWLRGHKMFDPSSPDPYKYARIGSSDVWRSHILRQDFGRDVEFVKAFLDTIYDNAGKTVIGTKELREKLIPALRAWTSSASFSHLSYQENLTLIQHLRKSET